MQLFKPTFRAKKVTDITEKFLIKNNFCGIILDIDDTLTPHECPTAKPEIITWINGLKEVNIKIILVSNNFKERVRKFAEQLDVPYISTGLKPLPFGMKKAIKKLKLLPNNLLVIGDQIFTDVVGANFLNIKSVLVDPISPSKTLVLKLKRFFEKPILKNSDFKYDSFD